MQLLEVLRLSRSRSIIMAGGGRPNVAVILVNGLPSKLCPNCNRLLSLFNFASDNSKSDGRTSFCKECRNKYKKHYRSTDEGKQATKRFQFVRSILQPEKDEAKNKVANALASGSIHKPTSCEICNKETANLQAHHQDYSKPLDVNWVCKDCHAFVHSDFFKNYETNRGRR